MGTMSLTKLTLGTSTAAAAVDKHVEFAADAAVQRAYRHAEIMQVLTPDQRAELEALRAAYRSALEDPALLETASRMGRPIEPAYGDDVRQLVVGALDQTPESIQIITRALNADPL